MVHRRGFCLQLIDVLGAVSCLDPDSGGDINSLCDFFNHGMDNLGALLHRSSRNQGDEAGDGDHTN